MFQVLWDSKQSISIENTFVKCLDNKRVEAISNNDISKATQISKQITSFLNTCHPGNGYGFDNLDLIIKRRNLTKTDNNYDHHWVNHKLIENRVGGNHLTSERPIADILEVPNIKFLPSLEDNEKQRMEYTILTSRIICNYFDLLAPLREVCIQHIPHKYTKEMSQPSKKV